MQNQVEAYGYLMLSLSVLLSSIFILACTPWFVWPFVWVISGASATGVYQKQKYKKNFSFLLQIKQT
jgi:hypothetical protein